MNSRKEPSFLTPMAESKKLISINEAVVYLGVGRSTALSYLDKIGAKRKIGRRTLYDKQVIDSALEKQAMQ